jgi:hypothetical protein
MKWQAIVSWRYWCVGVQWEPMRGYGRGPRTFTRVLVFLPLLTLIIDTKGRS